MSFYNRRIGYKVKYKNPFKSFMNGFENNFNLFYFNKLFWTVSENKRFLREPTLEDLIGLLKLGLSAIDGWNKDIEGRLDPVLTNNGEFKMIFENEIEINFLKILFFQLLAIYPEKDIINLGFLDKKSYLFYQNNTEFRLEVKPRTENLELKIEIVREDVRNFVKEILQEDSKFVRNPLYVIEIERLPNEYLKGIDIALYNRWKSTKDVMNHFPHSLDLKRIENFDNCHTVVL